VVYLVRSSRTYARIRSLTTGTFNLIVKDRTAIRRSGAYSVRQDPPKWILPSSKPYNHTVRGKTRQRAHPTEFPRVFHSGKSSGSADEGSSANQKQVPHRAFCPIRNDKACGAAHYSATQRATVRPSAGAKISTELKSAPARNLFRTLFGARASGRQKIEKRTYLLEVLALKVPFRNLLVVSESSPVAGTT